MGATGSWDDGWRTSDELLDTATAGLDFFRRFIPYYDQAATLAGGGANRGVTMDALQRPFDELRGIDFSMMRVDAEHLQSTIEHAENSQHNLDKYWGSLSGWTGDAAGAARAHRDRFGGMASGFLQGSRSGPGAITAGVAAIEETLKIYADYVRRLDRDTCGNLTPDQVAGAIRTAMGDIESMTAASYLAKVYDIGSGFVTGGAGWLADYFGAGASDQVERARQTMIEDAKRALQNFVADFDSDKAALDAWTEAVQRCVQESYDTMVANLRPMGEEAFKGLPDPTDFRQATTPQQATGPRPAAPPAVPGGQTRPSAGVAGSGATPVQRPPVPVGIGQPTQPGGTIAPPVQMPAPVPTVPTPVSTVPAGQPRPVTIPTGTGSVTVSPPDGQGRVRMTVADGANPPRTYDLDFGRGTSTSAVTGASGAVPGQTMPLGSAVPGGAGVPSAGTGGASPSGFGIPPVGAIGGAGAGAGTGASTGTGTPRLPSSLFPFSDKPADQLHPDQDGKVVIRDGDVTITVNSNEATDELTLTLDDGHGHQTTYRVDYHDPAHPTLHESGGPDSSLFGPTGQLPPEASRLPDLGPLPDFAAAGTGHTGPGDSPNTGMAGIGGGHGAGAGLAAAHLPGPGGVSGSTGQLDQGAFTGKVGGVAPVAPAAAAPGPAAAGPAPAGGQMAGGMPMGAMGAGHGNQDKERGGNRWLGRQDVITEDSEERAKAVKAGGVLGEDKKK